MTNEQEKERLRKEAEKEFRIVVDRAAFDYDTILEQADVAYQKIAKPAWEKLQAKLKQIEEI